jgi:hypothetical protein
MRMALHEPSMKIYTTELLCVSPTGPQLGGADVIGTVFPYKKKYESKNCLVGRIEDPFIVDFNQCVEGIRITGTIPQVNVALPA